MTSLAKSSSDQKGFSMAARGSSHDCPAIDPRAFRDALGLYASGITVISSHYDSKPIGFTCQSFYSVSVDPPLVSFSVMTTSSTYPKIREMGKFSVNVLAENQRSISDQFARKAADKWAGIKWSQFQSRNPAIENALLNLDCKLVDEHLAGDHYIVVGQVLAMRCTTPETVKPLLYFKGKYRHLHVQSELSND